MATTLTVNGVSYSFPSTGDENWGDNVSNWASAVTSGMLQKAGGTFTLTAEVDFGASFGLKASYLKSRATNPSSAGVVRLGNAESVGWRNAANNGDKLLKVNASDQLEYDGSVVQTAISVLDTSTIDLTLTGAQISAAIVSDSITNAMINSAAAIAYSKLNLTGSIVNADVSASAAIAYSKLAALTASRVLVSDGSGVVSASSVTSTTLGYLDATSSIQTQLDGKQATGNYITALTGDVAASGPGSAAASIQAGVITNAMINAAAAIAYSKLNLSGSIVNADVNAAAAIAYSKLNLSGSIVNADINASAAIAVSKLAAVTASRVLVSDASGFVSASSVTSTTLGYLDATSSIQTQLDGKISSANPTFSGTITTPLTASRAVVTGASSELSASAATATEVGYLSGVTSAIQTQLDSKAAKNLSFVSKTTTYEFATTDYGVLASTSGGSWTLSLPTSAPSTGQVFYIKKTTSDFNVLTVSGNGRNIDGSASTKVCTYGETLKLMYNGTQYEILDRRIPSSWTSYTPTGDWVANSPTYTGKWKRVGDTIMIQAKVVCGGVPTNTEFTFDLPSGLTIETSNVLNAASALQVLGTAKLVDSGVASYEGIVLYSTTTDVIVRALPANGTYLQTQSLSTSVPFSWNSNDYVVATFSVPITDWAA